MEVNNREQNIYRARSAGGVLTGCGGYYAIKKYGFNLYRKCTADFRKQNNSKNNDEFLNLSKKLVERSEFKQGGIKILNFTPDVEKRITNARTDYFKHKYKNITPNFLKEKLICREIKKMKKHHKAVSDGINAFFLPANKEVIINTSKFAVAIPHELGHAQNAISNSFIKTTIREMRRPFSKCAPLILAIGLLKPKRNKGEEPKNSLDKADYFVKEHCGLLMALTTLPVLIEEASASINAKNMAKEFLSKDLLKHMNKINFVGWSSYLLNTLLMGIAGASAVFLKDKIAGKRNDIIN